MRRQSSSTETPPCSDAACTAMMSVSDDLAGMLGWSTTWDGVPTCGRGGPRGRGRPARAITGPVLALMRGERRVVCWPRRAVTLVNFTTAFDAVARLMD